MKKALVSLAAAAAVILGATACSTDTPNNETPKTSTPKATPTVDPAAETPEPDAEPADANPFAVPFDNTIEGSVTDPKGKTTTRQGGLRAEFVSATIADPAAIEDDEQGSSEFAEGPTEGFTSVTARVKVTAWEPGSVVPQPEFEEFSLYEMQYGPNRLPGGYVWEAMGHEGELENEATPRQISHGHPVDFYSTFSVPDDQISDLALVVNFDGMGDTYTFTDITAEQN